ncbi:MAG: hypothetical protein NVS9B9_27910 [Ktedonobacteraceae bacterium]
MHKVQQMINECISRAQQDLPNNRESAIVITKLEEASLWCARMIEITMSKAKDNAGVRVSTPTPTA